MTVIERMARAICCPNSRCWADTVGGAAVCKADPEKARAAIEEIQEPTEEMILAGYGTDDYVQGHDCGAIWRLMAAQALGGTGE